MICEVRPILPCAVTRPTREFWQLQRQFSSIRCYKIPAFEKLRAPGQFLEVESARDSVIVAPESQVGELRLRSWHREGAVQQRLLLLMWSSPCGEDQRMRRYAESQQFLLQGILGSSQHNPATRIDLINLYIRDPSHRLDAHQGCKG